MTRIACFYVTLHPAAAASHPAGTELVPVSPADEHAYWRGLRARWDGTGDLLVLEQDIEIHAGVTAQLADCPSPWCTFPYLPHSWGNPRLDVTGNADRAAAAGALCRSLGCARFTAALQRAVPLPAGPVPWQHCDAVIAGTLAAAGIPACLHEPWVTNHHWTAAG